jgi:hypothetical protein
MTLLPVLAAVLLSAARPAAAADPAGEWDVRVRALEAFRAQDWPRAAELHAQAVAANPWDGALWERYGLALHAAGRHDEAIPAFEKCKDLGARPPEASYNQACAHARAGRVREALDALDDAYARGFADDHLVRTDHDLDALRGERRFAEIAGLPADPGLDRDGRWRADLRYLDTRLRRLHFAPFASLPEEEYARRLEEVVASVPERTDEQLRWEIQRLLASIGDGHTTVVPEWFRALHGGGGAAFDVYAADFWWYDDGLRLRRVAAGEGWAAGARVTAVGGRPVREALDLALSVTSRDNEHGARWMAMAVLRSPSAMRALGLADADGALALEVETAAGSRAITLRPVRHGDEGAMADASDGADRPLPLYRAHREEPYRFQVLDDGIAYLLFNSVRDGHGETIAGLAERMFREAEEAGATALVIDLRNNHGGSGHLTRPLLHGAVASRFNRAGALWVLIGRETFSAAQAFAAELEEHAVVRFAGEPTGSRPNFVGETTVFELPYSRLPVSCSNRWHQATSSLDRRVWIAPHVAAPVTAEDYAANRDPALDAVRAIVAGIPSP